MFKQGRYYEFSLLICIIISIFLLSIDRSSYYTNKIKGQLSVVFTPIYYVANFSGDIIPGVSSFFTEKSDLITENSRLKFEKLQLEGMLQKFTSIKQENQRLRQLLKSSAKVSDKLLVAELLYVASEPGVEQFVLNQGANQSVFTGQAVIDSNGIVGQVLNVNPFNSRVLLITDIEHAIPVEILRNNYRAIAVGMGNKQHLELANVPNTVDIIIGDVVVSSGLGRRFPNGYPVGRVVSIDKNTSLPFAKIIIEPIAKLNQIREVLLIWPGNKVSLSNDNDITQPLSNLNSDSQGKLSKAKNLNKFSNVNELSSSSLTSNLSGG